MRARALFAFLALCLEAAAQGPPGYYDSVDGSSPGALRATLHAVIDDHQRYPYTSGSTDTWDILEIAQQDPADAGRILDVYKNASYAKIGGGVGVYDREHTWPKSYGFPDDGGTNYPYTDCHMLWLCDSSYNASRSNKPFRYCHAFHSEQPTLANDGQGGGCCSYPGNSNWTEGALTQGTWETWVGRRGDVARAILYADLRYEGGQHGVTGASEPDLIATDNEALIDASNTGGNEAIGHMGMLSALLAWHAEDPPDAWELSRNDVVYAFQGNRNPFVDHPEWAACLYTGLCGTPPPEIVCTAKLSSTFCFPAIGFSGAPSVSPASPFEVTGAMIVNNKNGILFYGFAAANIAFQGGTLCAQPPLRRLPLQNSGGNPPPNDCSGSYAFDFAAQIQSGADPLLAVGQEVVCQWWFRDPFDLFGFGVGLSDALAFEIGP